MICGHLGMNDHMPWLSFVSAFFGGISPIEYGPVVPSAMRI